MIPELYARQLEEQKLIHYSSGLQALKDLTDLGNADSSMAQDYAGRFAFELMQNGADAYQKASTQNPELFPYFEGRVCFTLTENCLVVANTGTPFSCEPDPEDRPDISSLESISRLGESTKKSGQYIGNKGMGFRSIYQICDRLWLVSGGHQLLYDGRRTWRQIRDRLHANPDGQSEESLAYLNEYRDRIPMLKIGYWFELKDLPAEVETIVLDLLQEGYATVLVLERLGKDSTVQIDRDFIWDRLASLNEKEILFLDTLGEVHCRNIDEQSRSFTFQMKRQDDKRTISRFPDQAEWSFLVYSSSIPGIKKKAKIAFLLDGEGNPVPAPVSDRVFYSFYPAALESHGFPFFLHSYFMLNPNREYFNCEDHESIERNRVLLKGLSAHLVKCVVPDLRKRFPDVFLPDLLLPKLTEQARDHLSDLARFKKPSNELLSRQGALATWFIRESLERLSREGLVLTLSSAYSSITEVHSASDRSTARAADKLLKRLSEISSVRGHPSCLTYYNERLLDATSSIRDLYDGTPLSLEPIESVLETAGPELTLEAPESAALVFLLSQLSGTDNESLRNAIERIRAAKVRVLPCLGQYNFQSLPEYPEQGKLSKASAASPLVFYPPSSAEVDPGDSAPVTQQNIPPFCHVHLLKDDVLNIDEVLKTASGMMVARGDHKIQKIGPDGIRTILREQFGLRPFKPEDIFVRIAESTLGVDSEGSSLTPQEHREFLEATIRLVERRRLRLAAREPANDPEAWYLKERSDSDWRLFYYMARSYVPLKTGWERGDRVILAGKLGSRGNEMRPAYQGTDQVFLTELDEEEWFVELLNKYHEESKGPDDEIERLRFRRYVYLLLGCWDGMRLDIVHHPEGIHSPGTDPSINPHYFVRDADWTDYIDTSKCPWSYDLRQCRLIQSAAIPHLEELSNDVDTKALVISELQQSLDAIRRYSKVEVRTMNNSPGNMQSLLCRQLQEYPWVESSIRDPAICKKAKVWFTRQNIAPVTHERQSAHYLRSVTARQMSEALARAIEMPVLEESDKGQLDDFVELYRDLCNRVRLRPPPGLGFLTLYRTVVSRIQQIIVGTGPLGDGKFENVLAAIREAGVVVRKDTGSELELRQVPGKVYYDDTGVQNPVFRRFLSTVAFDDTSQGFAKRLGIRLLSEADVKYYDETDSSFVGNEEIEQEAKDTLRELRAPLFALRAYSTFIPEAQRLIVGEEAYNKRWETFSNLRVEVVPQLRLSIDGSQSKEVPSQFSVVLEHKSQNDGTRRLFIRKTSLTSDNRIPLRLLARPLAAILGAETQTIAVEMLLQQYESDGLEAVLAYLLEQCEVTSEQIHVIEDLDKDQRDARNKQVTKMENILLRALEQHFPSVANSEDERGELHNLISNALSLQSIPLLDYLQNNLGVPLHLLASEIGLNPFQSNIDSFLAWKVAFRRRSLLAVATALKVHEPSPNWSKIVASYGSLHLPAETEYKLRPTEEEVLQPFATWLREYGSELRSDGGQEPSSSEQELWAALFPEPSEEDPQGNIAILNVFIPWALALCRKASALPVSELLAVMDEYMLEELAEKPDHLDEIRSQFEDFLNRFNVSQEAIEGLFRAWPIKVNIAETGIDAEEVEKLRMEIEKHKSRQLSRSRKQVNSYRWHLKDLAARQELPEEPIEVSFKTEGTTPEPTGPSPVKTHRRVKRQKVTEEQFLAVDFRKRVIGECAEYFVLEVQRMRWKQLTESSPDLARSRLSELRQYYDFEELVETDDGLESKWRHLNNIEPTEWTSEDNWPALRKLLYMADWSPSAGYDVLGLDGENQEIFRIEVKATGGKSKLDFPISRNELEEAARDGETYVIWRALDIAQGRLPRFFRLENPKRLIDEGKILTADQVTILRPLLHKFH